MQKYIIAYYDIAFYNIPGEYHEYTRYLVFRRWFYALYKNETKNTGKANSLYRLFMEEDE